LPLIAVCAIAVAAPLVFITTLVAGGVRAGSGRATRPIRRE
jgi:hypothetical protein